MLYHSFSIATYCIYNKSWALPFLDVLATLAPNHWFYWMIWKIVRYSMAPKIYLDVMNLGFTGLNSLIYFVFGYQFIFESILMIYLIHTMILIIISSVLVVALIAVAFLKIKQKIMILGGCVILLVIANLVN